VFVLPIGHDQSVYGRSWLTYTLIVIHVVVFAATWFPQRDADQRIERALGELETAMATYPEARVKPAVIAGLPSALREALAPVVSEDADQDEEGAPELTRASKRLVQAVTTSPTHRYGYRPSDPRPLGFFTNPLLHADIWHLAGNMIFLWLAGTVIECFWERFPYALLYLLASVAGTASHHLAAPTSSATLVGASGAIAGLLGAFVVGHPRTRIEFLYAAWLFRPFAGTFSVRAWIILPLWFAAQIALAVTTSGPGVAYYAHVGGFVVGVVGALVMRWSGRVFHDADEVVKRAS
jgi:membrane associated rhomboid family serine protease